MLGVDTEDDAAEIMEVGVTWEEERWWGRYGWWVYWLWGDRFSGGELAPEEKDVRGVGSCWTWTESGPDPAGSAGGSFCMASASKRASAVGSCPGACWFWKSPLVESRCFEAEEAEAEEGAW